MNNENGRLRHDSRYANERFLIFPDDPPKVAWDILIGICLVYTCLVVPYTIAFVEVGDPFEEEDRIIGIMIDVIFSIDIFLNFLTAYFDNEENLIVNKKKIAINYLTGWFLLDFLSTLPFD